MLRTLKRTRDYTQLQRLAGIAVFTLLTVIAAKVSIPLAPVPFTLQVLVVLLSGMVLGWRDGMASQIFYVGLIAMNLPFDARHVGAAALLGPTAGFLVSFIPAAAVAGLLVEKGADRVWQRWLAGVVGIVVIYAFGASWLKISTGMEWSRAWELGVAPFIAFDLLKALIAAGITESSRVGLLRLLNPEKR